MQPNRKVRTFTVMYCCCALLVHSLLILSNQKFNAADWQSGDEILQSGFEAFRQEIHKTISRAVWFIFRSRLLHLRMANAVILAILGLGTRWSTSWSDKVATTEKVVGQMIAKLEFEKSSSAARGSSTAKTASLISRSRHCWDSIDHNPGGQLTKSPSPSRASETNDRLQGHAVSL